MKKPISERLPVTAPRVLFALAITAILGLALPKSVALPAVCVLVFLISAWLMDWGILRYARSLKERGLLIPQPEKKQIEGSKAGEFLVMAIGDVLEVIMRGFLGH